MILNYRRNRRRRGRGEERGERGEGGREGGGEGGREGGGKGEGEAEERKRGKKSAMLLIVLVCVLNIVWQVHASPFYIGNASYYRSCLLICLLTWCVECTASVGKHYFYRRHTNETTSKGGRTREGEETCGRTKKRN